MNSPWNTPRRKGLGLVLVMLSCAWCGAFAWGQESVKLTEQRWREHAYGVSLQAPVDAELYERIVDDPMPWTLGSSGKPHTVSLREIRGSFNLEPIREQLKQTDQATDLLQQIQGQRQLSAAGTGRILQHIGEDAQLRMVSRDEYVLSFHIKRAKDPLDIEEVVESALQTVGGTYPSALLLEKQLVAYAGRPGALIYYEIPESRDKSRLLGQAFMQIDPTTFALLRLDVDKTAAAAGRAALEAVAGSLLVDDPRLLDNQRTMSIKRGELWRKQVTVDKLRAACVPELWLRIIDPSGDIGYLRMMQKPATELGLPGIKIEVQARIHEGGNAYDSQSEFFLSDDRTQELWSIRTTARPIHAQAGQAPQTVAPAAQVTWSETGVRSTHSLSVTREGPSGVERFDWTTPTEGYLSQVELHLMGAFLPRQSPEPLGFYAYYPAVGSISFRTVRVVPLPEGSYQVLTRPSPSRSEVVAQYDRAGKLVGHLITGGRCLLVSSREDLAKVWKVK